MLLLGGIPSHDDLVEVVDHGAGDQRVGRDDVQDREEDDDVREGMEGNVVSGLCQGNLRREGLCEGGCVIDLTTHHLWSII